MSTFNKYRTKGAYHYDWYETEDWYKWAVDKCVDFCKGPTIDLGGGDGVVARKILDNGYKAVVVDGDQDATSIAVSKGIEAWWMDLDKQWPRGEFDYLASINVIEHLNKPENVKEAIKEVSKGAIVITIEYQGGSLGEDHKFEWSYEEMMDFFKEFKPKGFRYKDSEWIGVEIKK